MKDHSAVFRRSIVIDAPPGTVWALVHPAEAAPAHDRRILQAFTVPGTPRGEVGEQQTFWYRRLRFRKITLEVVELGPGLRAVTVLRKPVPRRPSRTITTVEPSEDGCGSRLTIESQTVFRRISRGQEKRLRRLSDKELHRFLEGVRKAVESGAPLPGRTT